ncbi:MAG TPA: nucleotidyltransferase family protein [Bacteroidia bacterium]|nr:nucleotidyltransferase family protein [Bacteroidia bacterium]
MLTLRESNLDLLLYNIQKQTGKVLLSSKSQELLKQTFMIEAGIQSLQLHEIKRISQKSHDIPVIFMKGVTLCYWLNLQMYKRSVDIDILIEQKNIEKTVVLLKSLGYQIVPTKSHGEFSMKNGQGMLLDIHYDLSVSSPFFFIAAINIRDIVRNQVFVVQMQNECIRSFNREITFIHLCIHFTINHHLNDFILVYELITFLKKQGQLLNHEFILNYAKSNKLLSVLELTIIALHELSPIIVTDILLLKYTQSKKTSTRAQTFLNKYLVINNLLAGKRNNISHDHIAIYLSDSIPNIFSVFKGYVKRVVNQTS